LEVLVRGERKLIASDRQQLLRLLLSTYENYSAALRQNRSLSTLQLQLKTQNQQLQGECERLQAAHKKLADLPASHAPSAASGSRGQPPSGNRVLVAEDTALCQTLFARLLEKLGYHAEVVANGVEAVEAYTQRQYSAILMDIQMPTMGGFEATARIRQHEKASGKHVPIIAVTAHTQPGDRERCLAAGMDAYLPKPVTLEALSHALGQRAAQPFSSTKLSASGTARAGGRAERAS
jgi:CheY-like chemotaxis protein